MILRVLLAVGDERASRSIARGLARSHAVVARARGDEDLGARAEAEATDLVIADRAALGPDAPEAIRALRRLAGGPEVVVLTPEGGEQRASLLAAGAMAAIDGGLPRTPLDDVLQTLLERRMTARQLQLAVELSDEPYRLADFSSRSPAMREVLAVARRVADSDASLLILGETGVGKEYLARAVHAESSRAARPWIAVNCAALPETLLESQLFGHVAGAFTGAQRPHRGYFELAHGGTLLLDEIAELEPRLQVKLLRVLEEKRIRPLGSERAIDVDVRIIACTNRDLKEEMKAGRFRSDLYYRLGVVTLEVPPLRRRRQDVRDLVESHLAHHGRHLKRPVAGVEPEAMALLEGYAWPGNVRELSNVVERAVLLASAERIGVADLPEELRAGTGRAPEAAAPPPLPAVSIDGPWHEVREAALEQLERQYLERLLAACGGHVGNTARRAGVSPRTLYERMKRLGLKKEDFRATDVEPREASGPR